MVETFPTDGLGLAFRPRAERKRLQRLVNKNEPTIQADRRFFERRPDRLFRIRRMSAAEIGQLDLLDGVPSSSPSFGRARFTIVKNLGPGVRLRIFISGPSDEDGNSASDATAERLWNEHSATHPEMRDRETRLLAGMRLPGGPLHGDSCQSRPDR